MKTVILVVGKTFPKIAVVMKSFQETLDKKIGGLLALIGEEVVGRAREEYLSGPRPNRLGRISGDLARSVFYRVQESASSVLVGSNLKYAPIHEFGGTISAKNAPFLVFKTLDGTWHSVKKVVIPKRPFLAPSIKDSRENIRKLVGQTFMQAYKEAKAHGV